MTPDTPPQSEEEFHSQLKTLFHRAHANGIDVKGGWACRNGPEHPDWDIVVTEIQKPADD